MTGRTFKTSPKKRAYERAAYHAKKNDPMWRAKRQAYLAGYREKNRERVRRIGRESANRRWHIRAYGITTDDYDRMFAEQRGVCLICDQPETAMRDGKVKPLAVDHDHRTGQVRALLCHRCNAAIGLMFDDPDRLREAATYLERWGG